MLNNIRPIREWEGLSLEKAAEKTGILPGRLDGIESGETCGLAELRTIAYALGVGVMDLAGANIFPVQVYAKPCSIQGSQPSGDISAFCGYVGILSKGDWDYRWYPVTYNALCDIQDALPTGGILCVPTLNNKVLILNTGEISGIMCSRGPAGCPVLENWNTSDPELGLETVVYEAMPEYIECSVDGTPGRHEGRPGCFEGTELLEAILYSAKDKYIQSGCNNKVVVRYGQTVKTFTADITKNSSFPDGLNRFVLDKNMADGSGKYHFTTTEGNLVFGLYGNMAMIELPMVMAVKGAVEALGRGFGD